MKTTLRTSYHNYNGGINNFTVVVVLDEARRYLKGFGSSKSKEHATKRAKAFQNKMVNKFEHHKEEFAMNKRLSLTEWRSEEDRIFKILISLK